MWITIAAVAVIVAVLMLRWLLVQLRSDSLNRIAIDVEPYDAAQDSERGFGRTDLPAHALAAAVGREIENYPGVSGVRAGVIGRPDQPELRLKVTVGPDADLARVRRRITEQAIANARTALGTEHLPTQLQLIVRPRPRTSRTEI